MFYKKTYKTHRTPRHLEEEVKMDAHGNVVWKQVYDDTGAVTHTAEMEYQDKLLISKTEEDPFNDSASTTQYQYDENGKLVRSETRYTTGWSEVTTYTYTDLEEQVITLDDEGEEIQRISKKRDSKGRVIEEEQWYMGQPELHILTAYEETSEGLITRVHDVLNTYQINQCEQGGTLLWREEYLQDTLVFKEVLQAAPNETTQEWLVVAKSSNYAGASKRQLIKEGNTTHQLLFDEHGTCMLEIMTERDAEGKELVYREIPQVWMQDDPKFPTIYEYEYGVYGA